MMGDLYLMIAFTQGFHFHWHYRHPTQIQGQSWARTNGQPI
jgi:hypothetical protein